MEDSSGDARYAPPQALIEDLQSAGPAPGELATRGKRFVAAMVDGLIAFGVIWLLSLVLSFDLWNQEGRSLWSPRPVDSVIGFGSFLLLQGYLLIKRGQTIGKLIFKIRIVRPDGSAASIGRIIGLRYALASLLGIVPALGQIYAIVDCLFIFHSSRRCLHDRIADTIVVQA